MTQLKRQANESLLVGRIEIGYKCKYFFVHFVHVKYQREYTKKMTLLLLVLCEF